MEKLKGNGILRIKSCLGSCVLGQQASCKAALDFADVGHHVRCFNLKLKVACLPEAAAKIAIQEKT